MKKIIVLLMLAVFAVADTSAADTLRVCYLNALQFVSVKPVGRKVLEAMQPDIIIVWSSVSSAGGTTTRYWLDSTLGFRTTYAMTATGINPDFGITYDTTKFRHIRTRNRVGNTDNYEGTFLVRSALGGREDTIRCILLGSESSAKTETNRTAVVRRLPAFLSDKTILCWTIPFARFDEIAYQLLIDSAESGRPLRDPLANGRPWRAFDPDFASIYDLSLKTPETVNPYFDCTPVLGNGLDRRNNFMLHTPDLSIVPGSFKVFGNDGIDRRNGRTLNDPPNQTLSPKVAEDMMCYFGSLPVYGDFIFNTGIAGSGGAYEYRSAAYPNPSADRVTIPTEGNCKVIVWSAVGMSVASGTSTPDMTSLTLDISHLSNGAYCATTNSVNGARAFPFLIARR